MASISPFRIALRNGSIVTVRSPVEDDAAALLEHLMEIRQTSDYFVTTPGEGIQTVAEEREFIRKQNENPLGVVIIAEEGRRIVGGCVFRTGDRRRIAHHGTFGIGVNSTHRGLGIGRVLLTSLLGWATEHPTICKVCLGCFAENTRALKLYRSLGFVEESRRMGEFRDEQGRYFDDVQMMKWVKPPPMDVDEWLSRNGPRTA